MADITSYKCPNCGAAIEFEPGSEELTCKYCGTTLNIEALDALIAEETIESDAYGWDYNQLEEIKLDDQVIYACPNCGGQVIGDGSMAASCCPYCGNSIIVEQQLSGMLKPDTVVPFNFSKDDAMKKYEEFISGKKLLPSDFRTENVIEKMRGLYVPYWLFDCDSNFSARYRATKVNARQEGDYLVEVTSHYMVYRDGSISFENVPVDASSNLRPELMEALEPFDYSKAVDFKTAYLSGFFADRYDQDSDEVIRRANERITVSTNDAVNSTLSGYSSHTKTNGSIRFTNGKCRYALLPVYLFSTNYKGKVYTFAMNGQTGEFAGDLPEDKGKSFTTMITSFLMYAAIIFAVMFFLVK